MAALLGMIVGGCMAVYLLSKLIEWAILKRVLDDPVMGCILSVVLAYFLGVIIYSFGSMDGRPFAVRGIGLYLIPALIVGALRYRSRVKAQEKALSQSATDLEETFN